VGQAVEAGRGAEGRACKGPSSGHAPRGMPPSPCGPPLLLLLPTIVAFFELCRAPLTAQVTSGTTCHPRQAAAPAGRHHQQRLPQAARQRRQAVSSSTDSRGRGSSSSSWGLSCMFGTQGQSLTQMRTPMMTWTSRCYGLLSS
jgi:hypothetical protein